MNVLKVLNLSEIDSLGPVCLKKWDSLLYLDTYVWREDEEMIPGIISLLKTSNYIWSIDLRRLCLKHRNYFGLHLNTYV